ncbi:MAG: YheU family protein [Deltaproteobacteria bacterium]
MRSGLKDAIRYRKTFLSAIEEIKMSIHIIPIDKLSPEALQGIIEEFISRGGTDYGEIEASRETNFKQVKHKLENGLAVLVFDDEAETTNIFLMNDPILKKLETTTYL